MKKGPARAIHEMPNTGEMLRETQDDGPEQEATVPSWFVRTYHKHGADDATAHQPEASIQSPSAPKEADEFQYEELGAAYENYRRRIEDRFRMAQQIVDQQVARPPELQTHAPTPRRRIQVNPPSPQFENPPVFTERSTGRRKRVLGVSMPMAVVLTAFACAAGSAGGYFMANPNGLQSAAAASLALVDGFFDETKNAVAATSKSTGSSKIVKIAEVNVSDVAGPVNSPIPLEISALAPDISSPINLKISGLPPNSYLTTGTEVKQGEWMLRPDEIPAAQLIVQRSDSPELGLLVTALDAETGVEAAPGKTMKVALDLNAVPTPGLQPPPNSQAQLR